MDTNEPTTQNGWERIARLALDQLQNKVTCPICSTQAVTASWNLANIISDKASVELRCAACGATETLLLHEIVRFSASDRAMMIERIVREQIEPIADLIRQHAKTMPAAAFTTHALWDEAKWSATTFRWHPTSEAPPIMGLVFDNAEAGKEIFREAERQMNHSDRFEEIRVSIVEGPVPGEERRPGYSVHICADPESLAAHATAEDFVVDPSIVPFLGQWNRHYPIPGTSSMLTRFKREFAKHKEFLLAPAVRKPDGQLWFEPELGIIKNEIHFRYLMDITQDDPDAAAIILPQFIMPPAS